MSAVLAVPGRQHADERPSAVKVGTLDNGRVYYAQVEAVTQRSTSLSNVAGARPTTLEFDDTVTGPIANAADGTNYVGGDFRRVGLTSGQGLALDALSGRPIVAGYAMIAGRVTAAAPDGAAAGTSAARSGASGRPTKPYLFHMRADGSLDPNWNPRAQLGGERDRGDERRRLHRRHVQVRQWPAALSLAAIDAASGAADGVEPRTGQRHVDDRRYQRDDLRRRHVRQIGGFYRNHAAAIDAFANVLPWDPNTDGTVAKLAVAGSTVYAGGFFTTMSGQPRTMLAAIDRDQRQATAWNPARRRAPPAK